MFNKLRRKIMLMIVGITTVILVFASSLIYITITNTASNRKPIPNNAPDYTAEIEQIITHSINEEKKKAANELLTTLIFSSIAIEVIIALVSYFVAGELIKPVRENYESQKIFIANASHEIKTPLAAITANLEAADIKNNKWIKNVESETLKLTDLNTSLLNLARKDLITTTSEKQETNLKKIVDEILEPFEPKLKTRKIVKTISSHKNIKINRKDFKEIIEILIDNAIKYSKTTIKINQKDNELRIINDGATIPEEKLSHIFDRFYQVDKSSDGVGLGLSIAQTIAKNNDWKLTASSKDGQTVFTLKF